MAAGKTKRGGAEIAAGLARFPEILQRDMAAFNASGQYLDLPGASVFTIRGGQIDNSRQYRDGKSLVRQRESEPRS